MFKRLRQWWADQHAVAQAIDHEANALLHTKGRAGALFDLAERSRAVGLAPEERRRIAAVMERVQRLSPRPPRGDVGTRMLYSD